MDNTKDYALNTLQPALQWMLFIVSGLAFAAASWHPETNLSLLLALAAVFGIAWGSRECENLVRRFFAAGLIFSLLAFYWLPHTLTLFGGFPLIVSYLFFVIFAVFSAGQFALCGVLVNRFRQTALERFSLDLPLAWLITEYLYPKLFPWALAHPLIGWHGFSSLAEYVGVYPLSALLLWWGDVAISAMFVPLSSGMMLRKRVWVMLVCSALALLMGYRRTAEIHQLISATPAVNVALVQGNLATDEKGDVGLLQANIERYQALSKEAIKSGAELLLWPESVMNSWAPENINSVQGTKFDPFPGRTAPLLYGGLSYRERSSEDYARVLRERMGESAEDLKYLKFNTAFGVDSLGKVLGVYHKRVLMPFGEYLPGAEIFPSIKKLSPHTGDFNFGDKVQPIEFSVPHPDFPNGGLKVAISPLICYEDLVPRLARDAVQHGGDVLVNLTNDAWYGDSAAPRQHHLIAIWRAIETRRYLLRVTNTGYTAVVDPIGQTIGALRLFSEDFLIRAVHPMQLVTSYTKFGDALVWVLILLSLPFMFLKDREN